MPLKAVFFDMDDTLTDSYESDFQSFYQTGKVLGIKVSRKNHRKVQGNPASSKMKLLLKAKTKKDFVKIDKIFKLVEKRNLKLIKPLPGLYDLLKFLKQKKLKTAIITNRRKSVFEVVKRLKIKVDAIENGEDGLYKPNKKKMSRLLKHFRLKPSEVLYVGDADEDAKFAVNSKVKFALIYNKHYKNNWLLKKYSKKAITVRSLLELKQKIKQTLAKQGP